MRRLWAPLLTTLAALVLLTDVRGQQAQTIIGGVSPQAIKYTPIDTSNALRSPTLPGAIQRTPTVKPYGMGNVFPKISLGSWPPTLPNLSILPKKNQYQPNPIYGKNPFDKFKKP